MQTGETEHRPRVVLDSNVLISGFAFPGGAPYQVIRSLLLGEFVSVISPFILTEVNRNLLGKLRMQEDTVNEAMAFLREHCVVIEPRKEATVAELTPEDNQVIDCALQGEVQYLVTGDKGIQQLEEFQGVVIVSPADFLALLQAS